MLRRALPLAGLAVSTELTRRVDSEIHRLYAGVADIHEIPAAETAEIDASGGHDASSKRPHFGRASSGSSERSPAGTAIVLFSATIAAGVSFLIGRSLLRGWVEKIAAESEQFQAIDRAVASEGFKIILLLRLSAAASLGVASRVASARV